MDNRNERHRGNERNRPIERGQTSPAPLGQPGRGRALGSTRAGRGLGVSYCAGIEQMTLQRGAQGTNSATPLYMVRAATSKRHRRSAGESQRCAKAIVRLMKPPNSVRYAFGGFQSLSPLW